MCKYYMDSEWFMDLESTDATVVNLHKEDGWVFRTKGVRFAMRQRFPRMGEAITKGDFSSFQTWARVNGYSRFVTRIRGRDAI